jgi:hypothetical protein
MTAGRSSRTDQQSLPGVAPESLGVLEQALTLALVNITYLIPAGGDPKSALLIDRTVDDGLVLRFTARPDRKDDPRLKAFIEVFKSPQVNGWLPKRHDRRRPSQLASAIGEKKKPLCFASTGNKDLPSFRTNMKAPSRFVGLAWQSQIHGVASPGARSAREPNSIRSRRRR